MFNNLKDEQIALSIKILIGLMIILTTWFSINYINANYFQTGSEVENAIEKATKKIKDNPSDIKSRVALADILLGNNKNEEAIDNYKEALKIDDLYGPALLGIGVAYSKKNDNEQALKYFNKEISTASKGTAANIDKFLEQTYFYKAKVLIEQKKYPEAEKSLKESIKISPLMSDSYVLLGKVYIKMNKIEEAKKYFIKALKLNPNSQEAKKEMNKIGK